MAAPPSVIAGLDPAIPTTRQGRAFSRPCLLKQDGRVEPGHDDCAKTDHALGGKPGRRKTRMKDVMPPSRRNLLSWIAGAATILFGASFARTLFAGYHAGPVTDHFDGTRFRDPYGAPPRSVGDILRWQMSGRGAKWPDWVPSPFADRPPAEGRRPDDPDRLRRPCLASDPDRGHQPVVRSGVVGARLAGELCRAEAGQ